MESFLKLLKEIWPMVTWYFWRSRIDVRVPLLPFPAPFGDTFHLEVRNAGKGIVVCRVFLAGVFDDHDSPLPEITSEAEIYWSETLEKMKLSGSKKGLAAVVSVDRSDPDCPRLRVNTIITVPGKEPMRGQMFLGSPGQQQKEIRLTLRVVFYTDDKEVQLGATAFSANRW